MIERPDWNIESGGSAAVPAVEAPKAVAGSSINRPDWNVPVETNNEMDPDGYWAARKQRLDMTAPAPRTLDGRISRPDWSAPAATVESEVAADYVGSSVDPETGLPLSVIQALQREPDGLEAGLDDLREKIVQRWGDNAAQIAEWAGELSPKTLAAVVTVFRHNWHRRDADLLKLINSKLTLAQSAEFMAWMNKDYGE